MLFSIGIVFEVGLCLFIICLFKIYLIYTSKFSFIKDFVLFISSEVPATIILSK